MQKRIDALIILKQVANERMEVAEIVCDMQEYQSAVNEYNRIAREITWLSDIARLIYPSIVSDDYDKFRLDGIAIRLSFGSKRIVTPFNEKVSDISDQPSTHALLDTIDVQPVSYQFVYSLGLGEFPPVRMVANQINREWVRSDARLELFVQSVPLANTALFYIERMVKRYDLTQENFQWTQALYEWQRDESHQKLTRLMNSDPYMLKIKESAMWCWLMVEQLLWFYLAKDQYRIDWQLPL